MQSQCTSSTDLPLATSNKIELTHMISHENTREKEMEKNKPRCSHYTAHGALMSPACATQAISTATALLDVLSSLGPGRTLATCSPLTSSILSTSQGPGARPHCALVFNRGSGGASSSCSPAPACLPGPGLAPCLPPAALCTGTRSSVVWSPGSRSPHGRHALRQPDT